MLSVAEAKAAWPLVSVIGERIPLKRMGGRYVARCPFHDDQGRPNFVVFPRTSTWACFACGAQGDVLDFLTRWTGRPLTAVLGEAPPSRPPVVRIRVPSVSPATSPEAVHRALEAWRATLDLSAEHAEALRRRGFTDEALRRYRTHQPGPAPLAVAGAPGFIRTQSGSWWATGPRGLFIPVRNVDGQMVGAQIRVDQDHGGRYRWLSSGGRPGGVASGAPCHVAPGSGSTVWVTEGPLKADLAADRLGVPVLGLAGVTTWRKALPLLTALNAQVIILAFDRDSRLSTRQVVEQQANSLEAACHSLGLRVQRAEWPVSFKGLDDALAAGVAIRWSKKGACN